MDVARSAEFFMDIDAGAEPARGGLSFGPLWLAHVLILVFATDTEPGQPEQ